LSEKHRELERLERDRRKRLKEAAEDQRKADLAALRVRQKELELKRHGAGELRQLLTESRKTLENLVRELRESGAENVNVRDVKAFLGNLADSADSAREHVDQEDSQVREALKRFESEAEEREISPEKGKISLREGAEVLVVSTGKRGRLLRRLGSKRWSVEIGSIRLNISEEDLKPMAASKVEQPSYDVELKSSDGEGSPRAVFELDLRGCRLQEALSAVERQIDAASLSGLSLFSIIHGTGEGILGAGIHGFLKQNPVVEDYHFARPEEGGYGKTVVRLKS
jgi:DNA mismatch repair protein MutS2